MNSRVSSDDRMQAIQHAISGTFQEIADQVVPTVFVCQLNGCDRLLQTNPDMSLLFANNSFAKKHNVQYPVALVMCDQRHSEVLIFQDDQQITMGQEDTVLIDAEPEDKSMKSSSKLSPCASNANILNS